jgi:hypothetical protein
MLDVYNDFMILNPLLHLKITRESRNYLENLPTALVNHKNYKNHKILLKCTSISIYTFTPG